MSHTEVCWSNERDVAKKLVQSVVLLVFNDEMSMRITYLARDKLSGGRAGEGSPADMD